MIKVFATLDKDQVEEVESILFETSPNPWSTTYEHNTNRDSIIGYFDHEKEAQEAIINFRELYCIEKPFRFFFKEILDEDWKNSYKKHFHPWNIKNFYFVPAWLKNNYKIPKDSNFLYIDPGMAFGTGNHETTKLCLQSLLRYSVNNNSKSIIDIGCGSGIIAFTASKIGYGVVHAVDNDNEAVFNSIRNAKLNNIGKVSIQKKSLEEIDSNSKYDVVIINIQSDVLIRNSEKILSIVKTKGHLLMSGILATEAKDIQQEYEERLKNKNMNYKMTIENMNEWNLTSVRFQ